MPVSLKENICLFSADVCVFFFFLVLRVPSMQPRDEKKDLSDKRLHDTNKKDKNLRFLLGPHEMFLPLHHIERIKSIFIIHSAPVTLEAIS